MEKKDTVITELEENLRILKTNYDKNTKDKYNRINPFTENLINWKEKGQQLFPDKNTTVYDSATIIGDVIVGMNTWIGPFTILDGSGKLEIGSNCSISAGVKIFSHDSVKWALSGGKAKYEYQSVLIGNSCFIGTDSTICKGVSIGNHCLIGAGSVVTKNIPDFAIAAGVPAKIIGKVILNNDEVILDYFKRG